MTEKRISRRSWKYIFSQANLSTKQEIIDSCHFTHLFSIPTHLTDRERFLLFQLSEQLDDESTVVEIGSYLGASTSFLAAGIASKSNKSSKVYAVDTWSNLSMSEGERDTFETFSKNVEPLKNWIVPLQGYSSEVAEKFNQPIDLLFVDGDHSYQGVSSDLKAWLSNVKDGGLVVFHDHNWAEGVRQAVKEFIVPIQSEGGHYCDSIYWTRISHSQNNQNVPYVSVAIPTYKRHEYVLDALQGVIQQKLDFAYEVLILDNACDADLKGEIEAIACRSEVVIRYIPVPEIGLHNARNAAALQSTAEVIVYIDDDVIVPSGWLAALVEPFQASEVGGVAGKSVAQWEGDRPEWINLLPASYFSLLDLGEEIREMQFPDTPYGCNMAFRRRLILHLGGFPPDGFGGKRVEWYRGDGETGFAQRVYEAQHQIIYTGRSWLYHRIPTQRLTLDSIRSRSMKDSIGSFYSQIRQHHYGRKALLQLALKSWLKSLVFKTRSLLRRTHSSQNWFFDDLKATQTWTTALYQLKLILDPQLRRWVFRQDYWSKDREL